jgi:hypothetical protein
MKLLLMELHDNVPKCLFPTNLEHPPRTDTIHVPTNKLETYERCEAKYN